MADRLEVRHRAWATATLVLAVALAGCGPTRTTRPDGARVTCQAGPVAAEFGALPWLAYACDDGRSVALVSSPGNPASPFSFVLRPSENGVRVQGEGDGDRAATAAAFAELMALDDEALATLYTRALLAPDPDGG